MSAEHSPLSFFPPTLKLRRVRRYSGLILKAQYKNQKEKQKEEEDQKKSEERGTAFRISIELRAMM